MNKSKKSKVSSTALSKVVRLMLDADTRQAVIVVVNDGIALAHILILIATHTHTRWRLHASHFTARMLPVPL